ARSASRPRCTPRTHRHGAAARPQRAGGRQLDHRDWRGSGRSRSRRRGQARHRPGSRHAVPTLPPCTARRRGRGAGTRQGARRGDNALSAFPERRGRIMPNADVREMFARLSALNPKPVTELKYASPYELLVAVTLSAQSTDVGVNKATRRLFPVANTPAAIAALGVAWPKPYISTIGLYNAMADNVVAMAKLWIERHGGEVPRTRAELEALPDVGRKTANVVLNTAFGEPVMAVDTHIFRVANRTGLAHGRNVRAVEDRLLKRVPADYLRSEERRVG